MRKRKSYAGIHPAKSCSCAVTLVHRFQYVTRLDRHLGRFEPKVYIPLERTSANICSHSTCIILQPFHFSAYEKFLHVRREGVKQPAGASFAYAHTLRGSPLPYHFLSPNNATTPTGPFQLVSGCCGGPSCCSCQFEDCDVPLGSSLSLCNHFRCVDYVSWEDGGNLLGVAGSIYLDTEDSNSGCVGGLRTKVGNVPERFNPCVPSWRFFNVLGYSGAYCTYVLHLFLTWTS